MFFQEAGLPGEFSPDLFVDRVGRLVSEGVATVIGSFPDRPQGPSEIRGALAAVAYDDLFTGDKIAVELWWFVLPAHRGGRSAIGLLKAYEQWARDRGCRRCNMIHLESLQPEKIGRLYSSMGYSKVETAWSKSLK